MSDFKIDKKQRIPLYDIFVVKVSYNSSSHAEVESIFESSMPN